MQTWQECKYYMYWMKVNKYMWILGMQYKSWYILPTVPCHWLELQLKNEYSYNVHYIWVGNQRMNTVTLCMGWLMQHRNSKLGPLAAADLSLRMVQSSPPKHTSSNMYKYLGHLKVLYNLYFTKRKKVVNAQIQLQVQYSAKKAK